jgi:hypothetical protein
LGEGFSIGRRAAPCEDLRVKTRRHSRWFGALLAATSLALVVHVDSAQAAGETAPFAQRFGEAAFDVIVLRPLTAAALVAGSVFFVASVPLVGPYEGARGSIEGIRGSWQTFVYAPYEYTVLRDLGDF